ncbi:MAG TPA: tryptophan synthase subunit alpha [Candidatus Babeliales bacterium]|nr:tryptophan synthase subunit alpha [Candidatus Babeliales bacterium]
MSGQLAAAFARAKRERRVAFIPYIMAGDPDLGTTEAILTALSEAGADAIELGIPYSDPLADGPTIASAGARALANETRLSNVLELVQRRRWGNTPLLLFTYFNPVYRFGIERFAREAARAGAAGTIVPDCALEESEALRAALHESGLEMPLLVAPSTTRERATRIAAAATGFVYVVSRLGVTGAAKTPDFAPLRALLAMLRELTDKPLAVGFGLSRPREVREIAALADGVVVGSALIDAYEGFLGAEAAERVKEFVSPLIAATRNVSS